MKMRANRRGPSEAPGSAKAPEQAVSEWLNREARLPVILNIDVSGSMAGRPEEQLRGALADFAEQGKSDDFLASKIDIATVLFSDGTRVQPFQNFSTWVPPEIKVGRGTAMGSSLLTVKELTEARTAEYLSNGIHFYSPIVVTLSDGKPTDSPLLLERGSAWVQEMEAAEKLQFFPFAVDGADVTGPLSRLSKKHPVKSITAMNFRGLFDWLLESATNLSDEEPELPEYDDDAGDDNAGDDTPETSDQ